MSFHSPLFPYIPIACELNYCLLVAVGSEKAELLCVIHHSKWGSHPAGAGAESMLEMQTLVASPQTYYVRTSGRWDLGICVSQTSQMILMNATF